METVFPKYICYDNACQLHKYCAKRCANSEESLFLEKSIVEQCQTVYHPKLIKDLDGCNTMICEQRNSWISGYKHMVKHMNKFRFNFFFYLIFSYFNDIKLEDKINIFDPIKYDHNLDGKRKFVHLDSDESENDSNVQQKKKNSKP